MFNEWEYEPNEIKSDIILSEAPLALVKENIKAQFVDPLEHRKKDHITTFLNMYHFTKENEEEYELEEEEIDSIAQMRDNFYDFMQVMFKEYLGIGLVDFDDMAEDDQDDLIHFTYRFFLMNIKKNFVTYIMNYIEDHKSEYAVDDDDRTDVTTNTIKENVDDPEDIGILTNLNNIIGEILTSLDDCEDFLDKCDNDACLETRFVQDKYDNDIITGNFIRRYVDMLDYDFRSDIESKIRNKILKKYRKK